MILKSKLSGYFQARSAQWLIIFQACLSWCKELGISKMVGISNFKLPALRFHYFSSCKRKVCMYWEFLILGEFLSKISTRILGFTWLCNPILYLGVGCWVQLHCGKWQTFSGWRGSCSRRYFRRGPISFGQQSFTFGHSNQILMSSFISILAFFSTNGQFKFNTQPSNVTFLILLLGICAWHKSFTFQTYKSSVDYHVVRNYLKW